MLLCFAMMLCTAPIGTSADDDLIIEAEETVIDEGGTIIDAPSVSDTENDTYADAPAAENADACDHSEIDTDSSGNAVCAKCGTNFIVKIEKDGAVTYGTDINAAIENAEDGSTLTVISNERQYPLNNNLYVPNDTAITLDLNGKSLGGYALNVGGSSRRNSKLTVTDSAGNGAIGLDVRENGTLLFDPNNDFTKILQLGAYGGSIELRGGRIEKNSWGFDDAHTINLTSLLAPGYAYRDYSNGWEGDWVKLSDLTGRNVIRNFELAVRKCLHPGTAEVCEYCGKTAVAKMSDWDDKNPKWCFDIKEAFSSVNRGEEKKIAILRNGEYTFTEDIPVYGSVNCHFVNPSGLGNIVKFDDGHSFVVNAGGALTLGEKMHIGAVTVMADGGIGLQGDATIDNLILEENCQVFGNGKLRMGNFGKITVPEGHSVGEVVEKSYNTEYSFKHIGGTWATEAELSANEIENVTVNALPFSYPGLDIKLDGDCLDITGKLEQVYDGNNKLNLGVTVKNGNVESCKWAIDYYAPDSDSIAETKNSTDESLTGFKLEKVGTYKIRCTVTADGYSREITGKDVVISKGYAICTAAPIPADDLTYGGGSQKLLKTAGTAYGGTMRYSLDGENWSEDIPTASEANTYTVYYMVCGYENYIDSVVESVEVTINPYVFTNISASIEKTYDGTANLPSDVDVSFTVSDVTVLLSEGVDYIIKDGGYSSSNAGDYTDVTLKIELINSNYAFKDGEGTTSEKEFTVEGKINKANAPNDAFGTLTIVRGVNNTEYTIDLNDVLGALPEGCTYGNITYGTPDVDISDGDIGEARINDSELTLPVNEYSPSAPKTVGYIIISVSTTNYADFTMTVSVEAVDKIVPDEGAPELNNDTLVYGEALGSITLSGSLYDSVNRVSVRGTFRWKHPDTVPEVGNYEAEWSFEPSDYRYTWATGKVTLEVVKAQSKYTEVPAAIVGLTYSGTAQALVSGGSVNGGRIMYSLDNNTWSYDIPTAVKADTYTVYCRIEGDSNYLDNDEEKIVTVKIEKAGIAIKSFDIAMKTYDGTKNADVTYVEFENYDGFEPGVDFTATAEFDDENAGENKSVTVTVVLKDTEKTKNYSLTNNTLTLDVFSIKQASIFLSDPVRKNGLTYNGTEQELVTPGTVSGGTLKYKIGNGEWQTEVPKAKNAGDYVVYYKVDGGVNYIGIGSASLNVMIDRADLAIEDFTLQSKTYDGTKNADVTAVGFETDNDLEPGIDFTATAEFDDENAGENKSATVTVDLKDTEKTKNYSLTNNTLTLDNFSIKQASPVENAEKKTTARVRRGRTLAEADVTNGELFGIDGTTVLDGTFAWADGTKAMDSDSTEQIIFTPADTNYMPITLNAEVSTYTSGGGGGGGIPVGTTYTVTFETNGGSTVKNQSVKRNNKVSEPSAPEKEGYKFSGWFSDKGLKTEYDFDAKVTKNLTLYAAWEKNETDADNPFDKPSESDAENPFDDVSKDDWYYDDVIKAVKNRLFTGTNGKNFDPNENITRGMFAAVLYRAEGEPAADNSVPFKDVSDGSYYANAVAWAHQNGIVNGVSENEFAPNENITREQIAAIIYRYAIYKNAAPQGAWAIRLNYADLESVSDYAAEAVMYCTLKKIMQGKDNNLFAPQDNATRAEAAAIINRFLETNK